jgi:hypothetical protein
MDSVNDYISAVLTNGGGGGGVMSDTSSGSETTSRLSDAALIDQNEVDSRVRRAEVRPVRDDRDDHRDDDDGSDDDRYDHGRMGMMIMYGGWW